MSRQPEPKERTDFINNLNSINMTQQESARYKAYKLSLAHLFENMAITKEVPAFEQTCLTAQKLLADIDATNNRRAEKLGGVTSKKQQHRDEVVRQALAIASIIAGYGTEHNDMGLKESMTFRISELRYTSEIRLLEYCNNILAKGWDMGSVLEPYGINTDKLKQFQLTMSQFADSKVQPRNEVAERKDARQQVSEMIKELTSIFNNRIDAMMLLFQPTHREFYGQYLTKRTIVNPGHRSTRIEGRVIGKAGNAELGNVKISLPGTDFVTYTNEDGTYVIKAPVLPAVKVEYVLEGYKTVTVEVTIKRGQASVQDIEMEPA